MRFKMTALALGLLLLVAPGAFAQYGGQSGTQTFTVPTLTVGPGPFTTSGTTTFSGDFTIGSSAQLLLPDGTITDPALTWTLEDDSGWYRAAANDFRFSIDADGTGGDAFRVRQVDADTMAYDFEGPQYTTNKIGMRFQVDEGATLNSFILYPPDAASITSTIKSTDSLGTFTLGTGGAGFDYNIQLWGDPTDSHIRHYDDGEFTNYVQLQFATATGTRTATFPDLTGDVLLGAANVLDTTVSFGTTVGVDSAKYQQTGNTITIDADDDDDGDGTVIIAAANSATQVRLDQGSVTISNFLELDSVAFAALGTPTDGSLIYCSDCTKATPCAGAGSGAVAKRINSAWDCD